MNFMNFIINNVNSIKPKRQIIACITTNVLRLINVLTVNIIVIIN